MYYKTLLKQVEFTEDRVGHDSNLKKEFDRKIDELNGKVEGLDGKVEGLQEDVKDIKGML